MFLLLNVLLLVVTFSVNAIQPDFRLNNNVKIINKCCPFGKYVGRSKTCVSYNKTLSFSTVKVYDDEVKDTGKSLEDVFSLNANKFQDKAFRSKAFDATILDYNVYLIENGSLLLELPNTYDRWTAIATSSYCVDYRVFVSWRITPGFWSILPEEDWIQIYYYVPIVSLLSCLILLLVLIVYTLLPELRNLGGLILMAHTFSLFMAFLLMGLFQVSMQTSLGCIIYTMLTYFFYLASFCWLNVLSFDIWWSFRDYTKAPAIQRRRQYFKFLMYGLFAFGVPSIMTVGLFMLNKMQSSLRHLPWLITPHIPEHGCFLEGPAEKLFLHIPMLTLVICNSVFYSMTALHIWRLSRGATVLDASAGNNQQSHRTYKQRLEIYLKLAVVMGLSWLLELVISLSVNKKIWWLSSTNNVIVSLAIFFIFVGKKEVAEKLCKRFMEWKTVCGCSKANIQLQEQFKPQSRIKD